MESPFPPREGPPKNAGKTWPTELLTPYEADLLFEPRRGPHQSNDIRDRAMLALMYRAELKIGEICSLKRRDYLAPSRQLRVTAGKKPTRVLPLDPECASAVDEWIVERRRLGITSPWLLCAVLPKYRGNQLKRERVADALRRRRARAGIDRRVTPETIRQSGRRYRGQPGSISASELHPDVARAVDQLIIDGHYDSAVRAGALALRDVVRRESGLHRLDGIELVSAALDATPPAIRLADLNTREGTNEQHGWASLARGCFAALRNAVSHREVEYTRLTAMEALSTMSLVARRITARESAS